MRTIAFDASAVGNSIVKSPAVADTVPPKSMTQIAELLFAVLYIIQPSAATVTLLNTSSVKSTVAVVPSVEIAAPSST